MSYIPRGILQVFSTKILPPPQVFDALLVKACWTVVGVAMSDRTRSVRRGGLESENTVACCCARCRGGVFIHGNHGVEDGAQVVRESGALELRGQRGPDVRRPGRSNEQILFELCVPLVPRARRGYSTRADSNSSNDGAPLVAMLARVPSS